MKPSRGILATLSIAALFSGVLLFSSGIYNVQAGDTSTRAYVAMGSANQISEINLENREITRTLEGSINPHGLAVTPDGRLLYATSMAETPQKQKGEFSGEESHHKETGGKSDHSIKSPLAGKAAVVETRTGKILTYIDVGGASHHAAVTRDGKFAVVTVPSKNGITVISTSTQKIITTVKTGAQSNFVLPSRNGKAVFVSNTGDGTVTVVDPGSWKILGQVKVGQGPGHLAESPDGRSIYSVNSFDGTVSVIDAATQKTIFTFKVGQNPHGIEVHPSGKIVYVSNKGGKTVSVYYPEKGKTEEWILGEKPYHVTVSPDGEEIYIGSRSLGKIWVLDSTNGTIKDEILTGAVPHQVVLVP